MKKKVARSRANGGTNPAAKKTGRGGSSETSDHLGMGVSALGQTMGMTVGHASEPHAINQEEMAKVNQIGQQIDQAKAVLANAFLNALGIANEVARLGGLQQTVITDIAKGKGLDLNKNWNFNFQNGTFTPLPEPTSTQKM